MNRNLAALLLASGALALSACAQKQPPPIAASLPPPGGVAAVASSDYDSNGNYIGPGSQADLRRSAGNDRVFFNVDSYSLDESEKETLRRQAIWLARYPNLSVTIEGHCDERGTRDYNFALGSRRANAAKNYLSSLGVSPARMNIASYGKERPEAPGSDERSWAQNRRAVTVAVR